MSKLDVMLDFVTAMSHTSSLGNYAENSRVEIGIFAIGVELLEHSLITRNYHKREDGD